LTISNVHKSAACRYPAPESLTASPECADDFNRNLRSSDERFLPRHSKTSAQVPATIGAAMLVPLLFL
jgi:hypothetical protein